MIWIAITIVMSVLFICECIVRCVKAKYKGQESCCDSCPMREECEAVRNDRY